MRTIKRYANRKLYDTSLRRYINLQEIAGLIQNGTEVRVIDSRSGEDITKVTLSQILLDKEKKKQGFVPKTLFANLIRKSGTQVTDYLKKSVDSGMGFITWGQAEIERGIKKLSKAGEITESEGRRLRDDLVSRLLKNKDEFEKMIDGRIRTIVHGLNIPQQRDINKLSDKLETLAKRVEALNSKPKKAAKRKVSATKSRTAKAPKKTVKKTKTTRPATKSKAPARKSSGTAVKAVPIKVAPAHANASVQAGG